MVVCVRRGRWKHPKQLEPLERLELLEPFPIERLGQFERLERFDAVLAEAYHRLRGRFLLKGTSSGKDQFAV